MNLKREIRPLLLVLIAGVSLALPAAADSQTECSEAFAASGAEKAVAQIFSNAGIRIDGNGPDDLIVHQAQFYRSFLRDPNLKLGELYVDGHWDAPHVDRVVTRLLEHELQSGWRTYVPLWRAPGLAALAALKSRFRYYRDRLTNRQTRSRAVVVGEEHYDIGNELYRRMLDPTLTYTSGIFAPGYTLEDAQNAKYDLIARKLGLKPGDRVLDIGSGFGGFARFAAKNYGAHVVGITISVEQLKAARALSVDYQNVQFLYSDYRDIPHRFEANTFDHVVSIEMIEAVGHKNLETYFKSAFASLKDGGRFVIQAFASNEDVVNSNPWFDKNIFRDGVAPSANQVDAAAKSTFGPPVDRHRITEHYDRTLMAWYRNFSAAWNDLKDGYSDRFKRMWDFYLLSMAAGFRSKKMQLDQLVFVKGAHRNEVPIVRELPSLEQVIALRATEQQKQFTALQIGALELKKHSLQNSLVPRTRRTPPVPLNKEASIAVIGAGPSGLSSARELRRLGYQNVTVFESAASAGGKSHTVEYEGRPHDMGATMGVKKKYSTIIQLAKEQGQMTNPFPNQVHYDLRTGRPVPEEGLGHQFKLAFQGLLYMIQHRRLAGPGDRGLEAPPSELADPWSVVMKRNGLGTFGKTMHTYLTGYGYGGPETPAVFGMRMLNVDAVLGAALSPPVMWQNGTQWIWKGLADELNVRLNTEVARVVRNDEGVFVYTQGVNRPERFDRVLVAVDPKTALKILDATEEEISVFSKVKVMPYSTFALRVDGVADGKSEVGYLNENMTLDRVGYPMAWVKRYSDDNVFVFHLFAPESLSDDQIIANISENMRRLGATKIVPIDSKRWPFFPHVDSDAMRLEHFYERALNLQGANRTVFVNEALAMSTMPDAAELGKKVAQRLVSGEYGD